ncbi:hypothetical protein LRY64_05415 [Candidatus Woesebacteria bacterium]|nr:hypothetical protein [Candidatus Woesebacteria bacterium]
MVGTAGVFLAGRSLVGATITRVLAFRVSNSCIVAGCGGVVTVVGVSLLGVAGVFWSWEWIIRVRQYVWRWLLEIGHGLVAITVMLGGMSQFSVEKMLLNILILLVGIAVLISIEQRYE